MPDERTYGFAKPDAIELINLIGNTDDEWLDRPPRQPKGGPCFPLQIIFYYDPSKPSPVQPFDWYNGGDPDKCGECEVVYPLGKPCPGDTVMAFWDRNKKKYVANDTRASMLGAPVQRDMLMEVGASTNDCGIYTVKVPYLVFKIHVGDECPEEEEVSEDIPLGSVIPVITSLDSASEPCKVGYGYQYIRAFLCEGSNGIDDISINLGTARYVSDVEFSPPACGDVTWEVQYVDAVKEWVRITDPNDGCTANTPPATNPTTKPEGYRETTTSTVDPDVGCGLKLTLRPLNCNDAYEDGTYGDETYAYAVLHLVEKVVVDDVTLDAYGLQISKASIYVCNYDGATGSQIDITTSCP